MSYSKVIIAEKPSLARAIASFLPGKPVKKDRWIECGDVAVTWQFGHLLEQLPPEGYRTEWKSWTRESLPIVPDRFRVEPRKQDGVPAQIAAIKKLSKETDVLVNAGDPDREGQLLVDETLEHIGWKGKTLRLLISAFDEKSVKKALADMKNNADNRFTGMRDAARARSEIDWLAGMNLTRAMTLYGRDAGASGVLSLGRVQTPTLALVVERDRTIENFKPQKYYVLSCPFTAEAGTFTALFEVPKTPDFPGKDSEGRLADVKVCAGVAKAVSGQPGEVVLAESKKQEELPPLPYSLSDLQKDASSKLGMGAQAVLDAAQSLYEKGLTTYPRTDCSYLPEDQFADAASVLAACGAYAPLKDVCAEADRSHKSRAWNSGKVSAHHAIIPTSQKPAGLSGNLASVYEMIALRYAWQFHAPRIVSTSKIVVETALGPQKVQWKATGKTELDPGWTKHRKGGEKKEVLLPPVKKGDPVKAGQVKTETKLTEPPARFTEGTLIDAMKNIQNFVGEDAEKEQKDALKHANGLGTEATRAGVIETLFKRGYIAKKGKSIVSTDTGRQLIDLCPASIRDPLSTADLEGALTDIADGRTEYEAFVKKYAGRLPGMIEEIFSREAKFKVDPKLACPQCGRALRRVKSKKTGKVFWSCSGYPACKYAAADEKGKPGKAFGEKKEAVDSGVVCPRCGKNNLVQRSGRNGTFWSCSGYPSCSFACPDRDGAPDPDKIEAEKSLPKGDWKCPECGKKLESILAKSGKIWWICRNEKKHKSKKAAFFADAGGRPEGL